MRSRACLQPSAPAASSSFISYAATAPIDAAGSGTTYVCGEAVLEREEAPGVHR